MVNERHELYLLGPNDLLDHRALVIIVLQVYQVLVSCNEHSIGQLGLQVHAEGFNPVPHGVRGLHPRQILEELRVNSHVGGLLMQVVLFGGVVVIVGNSLIVAEA
uniref:Uncharacterized protein n=1 Tax=Strombidium rassoulzadegani TaxID=1082188 RepID=A0A7S3CNK7_9SPIT